MRRHARARNLLLLLLQLHLALLHLLQHLLRGFHRGLISIVAGLVRVGGSLSPGDYVAVRVTDTGVGMTPELIAHVFEPFFTTKEAGLGSGLGLSQVHGLATQSGGDVRIVQHTPKGRAWRLRPPPEPDREADAKVRAFFERMIPAVRARD